MTETMPNHKYPMRDALASALKTFAGPEWDPEREGTCDECGAEYEDLNSDGQCERCWREENEDRDVWDDVLGVDVQRVVDVVLGVGGPTRFVRFWCDADGEPFRAEYHDSWAHPVDVVTLNDSEMTDILDALGGAEMLQTAP